MKDTVSHTFRSSRIFAEGWNAARAHSLESGGEHLNPYAPGPEHARWNEGFTQAMNPPRKAGRAG